MGFPGGSDGKESTCNVGDLGSIPRLGRPPGGWQTHSSILAWRIPVDRGAWWTTLHAVEESRTQESDYAHHIAYLNGLLSLNLAVRSS